MLVQYLRDEKRIPYGVLIAISDPTKKFRIGWSICNPKDLFNKQLGLKIAQNRLILNEYESLMYHNRIDPVVIETFVERCTKYFQKSDI